MDDFRKVEYLGVSLKEFVKVVFFRFSYKAFALVQLFLWFIGVWGIVEKMSFLGISWQCFYF